MYVPHYNAIEDEAQIRGMVADIGSAQLITVGSDGFPMATLLPVIERLRSSIVSQEEEAS